VEDLKSDNLFGTTSELASNSHFFSLYAARNDWDWVHVGLTTCYGYNERTFDVLNRNYDNHRFRGGLTYSF
jgi:hypothetical protein